MAHRTASPYVCAMTKGPVIEHRQLKGNTAADLRAHFRAGRYAGPTTGLAPGKLQCNVAILCETDARHFVAYCERNPAPCPLICVGDVGNPMLGKLGRDIDVRADLPAYHLHRDGQTRAVSDITRFWQSDSVAILLGCSLSFEEALVDSGIRLRHLERGGDIAAFRTNRATTTVGPFGGPLVVSMRAVAAKDADRARRITASYPHAHGAPLSVDDPRELGISDIENPDWGEPQNLRTDEVAMFWACGVTSHSALLNARLSMAITHAPGAMLITDLPADRPPPV
jgi:uncharacterized protein YcsI (UPF0317 family)